MDESEDLSAVRQPPVVDVPRQSNIEIFLRIKPVSTPAPGLQADEKEKAVQFTLQRDASQGSVEMLQCQPNPSF